jgi:hypothetical protein
MKDLKDRLKNRSDLEKLEQDLVVIERLVQAGAVGDKIKKLARQAREDLDAERSAHSALLPRLKSDQPAERQAARQEVERRFSAEEKKLFDPELGRWRATGEVIDEALRYEESLERLAAEICQIEAQLKDAAGMPRQLHRLHHLILRAEELQTQGNLSQDGKAGLIKAQEMYRSGCDLHINLTLEIFTGTLKERVKALADLKDWIASGEMWILVAPKKIWLPAKQVLDLAEQSRVDESKRLCAKEISRAENTAKTNLQAAIRELYKALDKSIPYLYTDREKLKVKYNELLEANRQQETALPQYGDDLISGPDKAGYIKIQSKYLDRMKGLFNQSHTWLNQFFHSTITKPVENLLTEAEDEKTSSKRANELIDMTIGLAKSAMAGSIEIPETMIRGAKILLNKGDWDRARELLLAALPLYTLEREDKIHRHAVAAWMLGCIEYILGNRFEGYSNFKNARELFEELRLQSQKEKHTGKADWYQARIKDMATYAIQTFEEVYFQWMNQFDSIKLPQNLTDYRAILDTQMGANQIAPLKKTLQKYLQNSKTDPVMEVGWTIEVDAAFYNYEIKNYYPALSHLNQAWIGFQSSHRGAVVLWLSGLIQWWFPSKVKKAGDNWENSIRIFQALSLAADQKNLKNQHDWYDSQIELMSTSMNDWIQLTKDS